jgi:hypothetical protein
MNPSVILCLACSSSLPPKLAAQLVTPHSNDKSLRSPATQSSEALFLTPCCARPICPSCLTRNPRLARYDPCLACLGGVRAVGRSKHSEPPKNIDGGLKDEDLFSVGDDEDEDEAVDGVSYSEAISLNPDVPPPYTPASSNGTTDTVAAEDIAKPREAMPGRYYIQTGDTLMGISLRLGVNVRGPNSLAVLLLANW